MDARPDTWRWSGGREAMLRFGPDDGPVVVAALPLWEEANRVRALVAAVLRLLAERGIGGVLPDLPGTGDSLVATENARLSTMREAHAALVEQLGRERRVYGAAVRSGALIDTESLLFGRWCLSPQSGDELIGDALRLRAAAGLKGDRYALVGGDGPVEIAGNQVAPEMLADLAGAESYDQPGVPRRTVHLSSHSGESPGGEHRVIPAFPPWRRAEPGHHPGLPALLADDIAAWIASCEA